MANNVNLDDIFELACGEFETITQPSSDQKNDNNNHDESDIEEFEIDDQFQQSCISKTNQLTQLIQNDMKHININEAVRQCDSMHLFTPCNIYANDSCLLIQRRPGHEEEITPIEDIDTELKKDTIEKPATLPLDLLFDKLWEKSDFCTYFIDEEYDTDSIKEDLYCMTKSNIMNKLHQIDETVSTMKDNVSKAGSLEYTICSLFDTNNAVMNCSSLIRICTILTQYESYINAQRKSAKDNLDDIPINIYENVYAKISEDYKDEHLLNDFNHLMHCHSTQFEEVYNVLLREVYEDVPCDLSECLFMKRNQMDKTERSQNSNMLKQLYFTLSKEEIISQQFIDRIHCHYFHSFDIGFRIRQQEKDDIVSGNYLRAQWKIGSKVKIYSESQQTWKIGKIEKIYHDKNGEWLVVKYDGYTTKEIQRFNQYIQPIDFSNDAITYGISKLIRYKRHRYRNVRGLERIYSKNNKYVTEEQKTESRLNEYRFGFRFFYHKYYKDNTEAHDAAGNWSTMGGMVVQHPANEGYTVGDMYITPKCKSLKDELLNNEEAIIGISQWEKLHFKAMVYMVTNCAREFICPRNKSAEYYEMNHGDGISTDHLIAMMIYCNFDTLQMKFSATFRRRDEKQSDDDIKKRHANFYFLGRLLRECVECFGMEHNGSPSFRLYHGINRIFKYRSLFAYIKGPCSTSKSYAVAQGFSANTGAILELSIDTLSWLVAFPIGEGIQGVQAVATSQRITCLDMVWISDYPSEQEIFTIGGLNRFYFNSIVEAPTANNYESYIKGIKQMTSGMTHGGMAADTVRLDIPKNRAERMIVCLLWRHLLDKYVPDHPFLLRAAESGLKDVDCPEYIKELMDAHCKDIRYITFPEKKQKVLDCILRDDNDWIRLDIVRKLFPKVNHLKYIANKKDLSFILDRIIKPMLYYIGQHGETAIPKINVSIDPKYKANIEKFIEKRYAQKFEEHGWKISVQYVDPVKKWSENLGFDIVTTIKSIGSVESMKKTTEKMIRDFGMYEALETFALGAGIDNFNIWKDYDKLGQLLLWMTKGN